jgi:hypothetical protein
MYSAFAERSIILSADVVVRPILYYYIVSIHFQYTPPLFNDIDVLLEIELRNQLHFSYGSFELEIVSRTIKDVMRCYLITELFPTQTPDFICMQNSCGDINNRKTYAGA